MQSRSNVLATLADLKDELATRFHVAKIGVFGSVSRDEQTPESDIDIQGLSSPGRSAFSPSWSWRRSSPTGSAHLSTW
ncbi:nucleotidyltransferase family protein [uncultured Methanofollis sp.]|uniref:nucleotidyltransferase family protein n=1 Tax=uncultured Methanofollis sp. TaxID=262500 RepID=UPI0026039688|nr:nucleotidyltransferase domain-containing protein [uncultured Methanofollis sp.]